MMSSGSTRSGSASSSVRRWWNARRYHRIGAAVILPVRVKPLLMALPWPVWKRVVYPLWLRWYHRSLASGRWKTGGYDPGDVVRWRGVRLVCCTGHFVGDQADHPWDPGWGWVAWKAGVLWEPCRSRDRLLLRFVGDPRRTEEAAETRRVEASSTETGGPSGVPDEGDPG